MLSILYDEYLKWGCPNCGCDAIKGSCVSGGGLTSGTCKHCGIHFEVRYSRHCEGWGSNPPVSAFIPL